MNNINAGSPPLPPDGSASFPADESVPLAPNESVPADDGASGSFFGKMPADVMKLIIDDMPIESVTNLGSTNRAMRRAHTTEGGTLHAAIIDLIREAAQSDGDIGKTHAALEAIDKAPLTLKPQLMRALAEKAPGIAMTLPGQKLPEWEAMLARVETALKEEYGTEYQGPLLRDLRIADVHALYTPVMGDSESWLTSVLDDAMQTFPPSEWGDFLRAANKLNLWQSGRNWTTFFQSGAALSRPASDTFACAIGIHLMENDAIPDPIACLERLGIAKMQIEAVVIPACASRLSENLAYRQEPVKTECDRWGKYADLLASHVQASVSLAHISDVRKSESEMRLFRVGMNPERVNENRIAFVKQFERDTIEALGDDQIEIDRFIALWQTAGEAVYTADAWLEQFERLTADTVPLMCQPALLDRWSLALTRNGGQTAATAARVDTMYTWLRSAVTEPALQSRPTLVGRMAVALVHALDAGSVGPARETVNMQRGVVAELYENQPPSAWGWMLELDLARSGTSPELASAPPFPAFVCDAMTSSPFASVSFQRAVVGAAAQIWEKVPDRARDGLSKFDVFCERFGIPVTSRVSTKQTILKGIVERAKSGEFTLPEGLALGGFDTDPIARQYAREASKYGVGW